MFVVTRSSKCKNQSLFVGFNLEVNDGSRMQLIGSFACVTPTGGPDLFMFFDADRSCFAPKISVAHLRGPLHDFFLQVALATDDARQFSSVHQNRQENKASQDPTRTVFFHASTPFLVCFLSFLDPFRSLFWPKLTDKQSKKEARRNQFEPCCERGLLPAASH